MESLSPSTGLQPGVVLYCIPNQQATQSIREFLRKKGVHFTEHDITQSAFYAQELMQKTGQNTQPLIVSGELQWVGWNSSVQAALQSALKL